MKLPIVLVAGETPNGREDIETHYTDTDLHVDGRPIHTLQMAFLFPDCPHHVPNTITAYIVTAVETTHHENGDRRVERVDARVVPGDRLKLGHVMEVAAGVELDPGDTGGLTVRSAEVHAVFACGHRAPLI